MANTQLRTTHHAPLSRKPLPAADPVAAYPLALAAVAKIEHDLHCGSLRYRSQSTALAFRRLWDVVNAYLLDDLVIHPLGRPPEQITAHALRTTE